LLNLNSNKKKKKHQSHERIIRIFKPLPTSWFTGLIGYLQGNMAELKNFNKVISSGEGREVTRVCS